jgi:hypothetical protein
LTFDTPPYRGPGPKQGGYGFSFHTRPNRGPGPSQGGCGLIFDMPPLGGRAQSRRIWFELRYAPYRGPGPQQGGYDFSFDTPPFGGQSKIWLDLRYAPLSGARAETKRIEITMWFGAMDATKPYEFIGFGQILNIRYRPRANYVEHRMTTRRWGLGSEAAPASLAAVPNPMNL